MKRKGDNMAYRKFYLENSLGKQFQLADKDVKVFLDGPTGLGFSNTLTTLRLGNSLKVTDEQIVMPTISGNILFYDTCSMAYQNYTDFANFIQYTPLKLYYLPPNLLIPYFVEGYISSLEKSQFDHDSGYISCTMTFSATSLWKNFKVNEYETKNIKETGGKYYDLVRPYHYSGSSLNTIRISNNGDIPVGFKFEVNGSITNPMLTAVQNGEAYGLLKLNGTFDYIIVNSNDAEQSIYLENEGSILSNPLRYQDLSIADGVADITFYKLKVGETYFAFTGDNVNTFDGTVKFTWQDERISI